MWKILKIDDKVTVVFEDGCFIEKANVTQDQYESILKASNEEEIYSILCPEYTQEKKEAEKTLRVLESVGLSSLLTKEGDSIYWRAISGLSLPPELVEAIIEAEKSEDHDKLETYKNFWTLMSLNPDERCRKNLFWFLNRNGLILSKCGFFIAYRNANYHSTDPDGTKVYTDAHSSTTRIRIGKVITMPREKCDDVQEHTCSRGLHLGARTWLKHNYFGNTGLVCLCNPADVVAVPPLDDYGKLRTCAYLPIDMAQFDANGDVIPFEASSGSPLFNCNYVNNVIYEGLMGTEEDSPYTITIPDTLGISRESISNRLLDIAMECITKRQI